MLFFVSQNYQLAQEKDFFFGNRIHFDNITRDELAAIEQEILLLQKLRHQHIVSYMVCIYVYVYLYVYMYTESERDKYTHTHT